MTQDIYKLANIGVQGLKPYAPGKPISELERELGIHEIIKLASNENPLGCSEKVKAVIQSSLNEINLYPDGNGFELKKAILETLKSSHVAGTDNIILGNGSNDVLELIARAFLNEGTEAIYSEYAFAVYPLAVQAVSAKAKVAPAKDWGHDLDAMLSLLTENTRVIFVANPNNPTGTWLNSEAVENFLKQVPENVIVVLDEAYFEYVDDSSYPDGVSLLSQYPNLIVTRTFSKAYGLAGLRVGYGLAAPEIIDILNRIRQPFNVNSLAQNAAIAALEDQTFIEASLKCNQEGLQYLFQALAESGFNFIPSVANFVCIDFGSEQAANKAYEFLLNHGMIIRPVAVYNMPSFLRATVGSKEQNEKLISLLQEFRKQNES